MRPTDLLTQWKGLHARFIVRAYNKTYGPKHLLSEHIGKGYLAQLLIREHHNTGMQSADWDLIARCAANLQEHWMAECASKRRYREHRAEQNTRETMKSSDLLTQWKGLHARSIAEAYNELVRPATGMQVPEWVDKLYLVRLLSDPPWQPADWDGILRRATEIQKQRDERLAETKKAWAHAAQRKIACVKLQQEYNALPYFGFEVKVVDPHAVVLTMSHRQLWDMAAALLDVNKRLNNTAVYHLRATSAWVTIEMPKTAFDELIPLLGARDVPLGSN